MRPFETEKKRAMETLGSSMGQYADYFCRGIIISLMDHLISLFNYDEEDDRYYFEQGSDVMARLLIDIRERAYKMKDLLSLKIEDE